MAVGDWDAVEQYKHIGDWYDRLHQIHITAKKLLMLTSEQANQQIIFIGRIL